MCVCTHSLFLNSEGMITESQGCNLKKDQVSGPMHTTPFCNQVDRYYSNSVYSDEDLNRQDLITEGQKHVRHTDSHLEVNMLILSPVTVLRTPE